MAMAQSEMSHCHEFDYLLVNDEFAKTLDELATIIKAAGLLDVKQAIRHEKLIKELIGD